MVRSEHCPSNHGTARSLKEYVKDNATDKNGTANVNMRKESCMLIFFQYK
jgi:hypothetical protein